MSNEWYGKLKKNDPLAQGELLFDFPLISWNIEESTSDFTINFDSSDSATKEHKKLLKSLVINKADVIILSQSCDLEHEKLENIVFCSHWSIDYYKQTWEEAMREREQNPTTNAWNSHFEDLCDGFIWNLTILAKNTICEPELAERVVNFYDLYTIPNEFVQIFVSKPKLKRCYLLPPYREHLAQSFARFFMRVGLPIPIK